MARTKTGVKDIEITGTVKDFAGLEGVPKSYDCALHKGGVRRLGIWRG